MYGQTVLLASPMLIPRMSILGTIYINKYLFDYNNEYRVFW